MQYEVSIDVRVPPDVIWAVWMAIERWPEWTPSIISIVRLDSSAFGPGSKVRIKQPKLPSMVWTVTECEPNRAFSWTAKSIGFTSLAEHRLVPSADGNTSVTLGVQQTGPLASLVWALYHGLTRRYVSREANGLKQRCEALAAQDAHP